MKMIVLQIFKTLMTLEIPQEIFDSAVALCTQSSEVNDKEVEAIKKVL